MKKILIVDDQPAICKYLTSLLSRKASVLTSGSLEDARTSLSLNKFDLVISDLSLDGNHGLQGFELLEHIRETSPDTKVMIMSASPRGEIREEALQRGAVEFLEKPFDIRRFLSTVRSECSIA